MPNNFEKLCMPIRLILSDIDGVLTDGGLTYQASGEEFKRFNIRDSLGIRLWQKAGFQFGFVSGRSSQIVRHRATELGIDLVRQGVRDKRESVERILESTGLIRDEVCYIGDDLPDLRAMRFVALGATVCDAPDEVRQGADWISHFPGGGGAVRELVETILKAQNVWSSTIQNYL